MKTIIEIQKSEIASNIKEINEFLLEMPAKDINQFMKNLNDIFFFYGFTEDIFRELIKEGKVPFSYPDKNLKELSGLTNAVLFQLKYKKGNGYFENVA